MIIGMCSNWIDQFRCMDQFSKHDPNEMFTVYNNVKQSNKKSARAQAQFMSVYEGNKLKKPMEPKELNSQHNRV